MFIDQVYYPAVSEGEDKKKGVGEGIRPYLTTLFQK